MAFDIEGAKKAGYSPSEIADFIAQDYGDFDIGAARESGYTDDEIISHLTASSIKKPSTAEDVAKTIGSGLVKGAASVPMVLGDTLNAAVAGPQYLYEGMIGEDRKDFQPYQPFFSSEEVVDMAGIGYTPQTTAGKVADMPARIAGSLAGTKAMQDPRAIINAGKGIVDDVSKTPVKSLLSSQSSGGRDVRPTPKAAQYSPIDRTMVHQASKNAYRVVDESSTALAPTWTDRQMDVIEAAKQKPLFGGKVLTKEQKEINEALEDYLAARGEKATMSDIQGLDSTLGDKIAEAYIAGKNNKARILSNVQDDIRDNLAVNKLSLEDVTGTREGIDALKDAIPLYSLQAKMKDIDKIVKRANAMQNPATGIQTGFRNLMLNERKFNSYPLEVRKMIEKGATTGMVDDALIIVGSRLNPIIGGAASGPKGAAISYATSKIGRKIRTDSANKKAQKILDAMTEPYRESIEKYYKMDFPQKGVPQDVFTPESAVIAPKLQNAPFSGMSEKAASMPPDAAALRLKMLNKKMEAGIITPAEMAERIALTGKKFKKGGKVKSDYNPLNHSNDLYKFMALA